MMGITSDKAERKVCPLLSIRVTPYANCRAGSCMFWIWDEGKPPIRGFVRGLNGGAKKEPKKRLYGVPDSWEWMPYGQEGRDLTESAGWMEPEEEYRKRMASWMENRTGGCGLAQPHIVIKEVCRNDY